jgi:hypothetical protein
MGSETDRILTVKVTVVEVAYYDTRIWEAAHLTMK